MKKAFVSIVSSYVGYCIASVLHRHEYDVVGSVRAEDTEDITVLVSQTVDADDEGATAELALSSDVVVLCLLEDVRGADAVISAFQKLSASESSRPGHLLVLSTTMTWAKTKPPTAGAFTFSEMPASPSSSSLLRMASTMAVDRRSPRGAGGGGTAGGSLPRVASAVSRSSPSRDGLRPVGTASSKNSGRPDYASTLSRQGFHEPNEEPAMTEAHYQMRQPPLGYLEHKRLEVAALQLDSPVLSTCVVGAGVPYGLGEGPLLRVVRGAWRARGTPVDLPTCTQGDNYVPLIHVADLSFAVGSLLRPVGPDALPDRFPKPYVLAVEGDESQCTARDMTSAIGRAFGGGGETRPIGEAELEELLVEDPAALSLLINVRFSNKGGVLAGMEAEGIFEPITWSQGFVASAQLVAREFVISRSLQQIKAVVLGPPGGDQGFVCQQISKKYGLLYCDTKVAVDGVFEALGKPLPVTALPEEKAPPAAKGKKAKDPKKGATKAEPSPEAQAAIAALSPTERLFADIQGAFEAAEVPFSDYTTLDAWGLASLLSPSIVARSTRVLLEGKKSQWACSGYILCNIPSQGECAADLFGDRPPKSPRESLRNNNVVTASSAAARDTGAGQGSGLCGPESVGGGRDPIDEADANYDTAASQRDLIVGQYRPTHVVYMDAYAEEIVARHRQRGAGGKEVEAKLRADLERYFAQEQETRVPDIMDGGPASAEKLYSCEKRQRRSVSGSRGENPSVPAEDVGFNGSGDIAHDKERWIPATARALQDRNAIETKVIDADCEGEGGALGAVVAAVDHHLCGGEMPGFVWMLAGEDADAAVEDGERSTQEQKRRRSESGGGVAFGEEDDVEAAAFVGGDLEAWARPADTDGAKDGEAAASKTCTVDNLTLTEVLAKLTTRDAKEVETRTRRHRNFLTDGVVPQVAAGLVAAAEAQPDNVFEFLADYLINAGKTLQRKAEEEAAEKYQAGLALLQEMEAKDRTRIAAAVYR